MPDTLDQAYYDAINTNISPIRVNQVGYLKNDPERQFYYVGTAKEFEVVDADGKSLSTKVTGTFTESGIKTSSDWTIIAGTAATTNDKKSPDPQALFKSVKFRRAYLPINACASRWVTKFPVPSL